MDTKAFTLAELLISVTILAMVGAVSFTAFSGLASKAAETAARSVVSNVLSGYDRQIRDAVIGSYEATFRVGDPGFSVDTDGYGLSDSGTLTAFDWGSASGSLHLASDLGGPWTIRLAQNSKLAQTASLSGTSVDLPLSFVASRYDERSVSVFLGSESKNRIVLLPFDPADSLLSLTDRLTLSSVRSGTVEYGTLTIRNVLGKREFLVSGTSVGSVTLSFSKGGRDFSIELRK